MPKAKGSAVDAAIGSQVRAVRRSRKMSQKRLGRLLGLTYQQVQKYETGTSRISVAVLLQIAQHLKVPFATFFEGLPHSVAAAAGQGSETAALLRAFDAIRSDPLRRQIVHLAQTLAAEGHSKPGR